MSNQSKPLGLSRADGAKTLSFGERLRDERARLRLSQNEFAELGGVKRSSQYLYEHDLRSPDAAYLAKINAGGVDVGYLFSGIPRFRVESGVGLTIEQALGAFRAVEDFARTTVAGVMPAQERERLFEILCGTRVGDPAGDQESESQERAS